MIPVIYQITLNSYHKLGLQMAKQDLRVVESHLILSFHLNIANTELLVIKHPVVKFKIANVIQNSKLVIVL